jgi:hypothetical protein
VLGAMLRLLECIIMLVLTTAYFANASARDEVALDSFGSRDEAVVNCDSSILDLSHSVVMFWGIPGAKFVRLQELVGKLNPVMCES